MTQKEITIVQNYLEKKYQELNATQMYERGLILNLIAQATHELDQPKSDAEKLKKYLLNCGKKFFIDNYFEIQAFYQGTMSRKGVETIIRSKEPWSKISTLGNRISQVKMFFENHQEIQCLEMTVNSRSDKKTLERAKEILTFEKNNKK